MAKQEWGYSVVFTASNTHHTFWDKLRFVMILVTFRASVGKPFCLFCVLLGSLFEVLFFSTFEVNRQAAANTERVGSGGVGSLKQLPP